MGDCRRLCSLCRPVSTTSLMFVSIGVRPLFIFNRDTEFLIGCIGRRLPLPRVNPNPRVNLDPSVNPNHTGTGLNPRNLENWTTKPIF